MTVIARLSLGGFRLEQTCGACPEQYDVFLDNSGEQVAYMRLRHGGFTVRVPDHNGALVYEAAPQGDGLFTREERPAYLREALYALENWLIDAKFHPSDSLDEDGGPWGEVRTVG